MLCPNGIGNCNLLTAGSCPLLVLAEPIGVVVSCLDAGVNRSGVLGFRLCVDFMESSVEAETCIRSFSVETKINSAIVFTIILSTFCHNDKLVQYMISI